MKNNVLIVEDHELTRFGLKTTFETCNFVDKIYETDSAEAGLEIVENNPIDLVILDLGLPGINGIDAAQKIKQFNKDIKIIILTSHNDKQEVLNSLKAGVNAYCSKEINPVRLIQVVQSVLDGAAWFDPSISHFVLEAASKSQQSDNLKPVKDYGLTSRETQILKLITEGYSNNEIANELFVDIDKDTVDIESIFGIASDIDPGVFGDGIYLKGASALKTAVAFIQIVDIRQTQPEYIRKIWRINSFHNRFH